MGFANYPPSRFFTFVIWVYSILAVLGGILTIYSVYLRGIVSLSHGVAIVISLFFMLLGGYFITNQLHYILIWEPRENKHQEMALKSAMENIPKLIESLGYDGWRVTNPNEFNIRFEYIIEDRILADFKLHTHSIIVSYADNKYKLWFGGYIDEVVVDMVVEIIRKLSDHFGLNYEISDITCDVPLSLTGDET